MKSRLVILFFAFVCIVLACNRPIYEGNMFYGDQMEYYMYLPAIFIYHDLDAMKLEHKKGQFNPPPGVSQWDVARSSNHVNKYSVGVALFELPAFLLADAYTMLCPGYNHDGFSPPFQIAGAFSTILWVIAGLFILRRFLLHYFADNTVAVVLAGTALATNLYYYSAFEYGMSHPFLFFLFCGVLLSVSKYDQFGRARDLYWLALFGGLVLITRPVDIISVFMLILFWRVYNFTTLQSRLSSLLSKAKRLTLALLIFLCLAFIQMCFWKYIYGHWLVYSYTDEGFNFLRPHIYEGLFSYKKGWFVYTPFALTGFFGFFFMWRNNRELFGTMLVYIMATLYVVFSWRDWWYGGSFGARPLIESLAPMSLPAGYLVQYVLSREKLVWKFAMFFLFAGCIMLNMFQSYQYSKAILHCDRMTRTFYWKVFGKLDVSWKDYQQYLAPDEDMKF